MGLVGSVVCNCLRDGTASPCPVGEVRLNGDGYWVLDLPWEGNEDAHVSLERWMETACSHPDMEATREDLANWSGYHSFRDALRALGDGGFPVLLRQLPEANGGLCPALSCQTMIDELDRFESLGKVSRTTWLVNSTTGERLHEHSGGIETVIVRNGRSGLEVGFDALGVSVRRLGGGDEVFRSRRIRQMLSDPDRTDQHEDGLTEFTDLESGQSKNLKIAIHGKTIPWPDGNWTDESGRSRLEYPPLLHVEDRNMLPADYQYILDPLRRLCEASIATGNPIRWA